MSADHLEQLIPDTGHCLQCKRAFHMPGWTAGSGILFWRLSSYRRWLARLAARRGWLGLGRTRRCGWTGRPTGIVRFGGWQHRLHKGQLEGQLGLPRGPRLCSSLVEQPHCLRQLARGELICLGLETLAQLIGHVQGHGLRAHTGQQQRPQVFYDLPRKLTGGGTHLHRIVYDGQASRHVSSGQGLDQPSDSLLRTGPQCRPDLCHRDSALVIRS